MHIYAFGSVARGDISYDSDVDMLALVDGIDTRFDPEVYSIYSYERIRELWREGNPFAWHLSLEAILIHSSDGSSFLNDLGQPAPYMNGHVDCQKFMAIFQDASVALQSGVDSQVFEFSVVFLAIRNFATCFSLATSEVPTFSRHSALEIKYPLRIDAAAYRTLSQARTLSTRGRGPVPTSSDALLVKFNLSAVDEWMRSLMAKWRYAHEGVSD
jgi:hypothetical protein